MSVDDALLSYTRDACFASFDESIRGSIRCGFKADIVVLERDIRHCSVDDIPKTNVLFTIVDGKIVYNKL